MVHLLSIVAILMGVGLCCPSVAQTPNGATDNELYASYCTGVLDEEMAAYQPGEKPSLEKIEKDLKQNNLDSSPEKLHQWAQELLAIREKSWEHLQAYQEERQNKRQRFGAYLVATGVLTDPKRDAVLGLTVAMNQGHQDSKQCSATIVRCMDTLPSQHPNEGSSDWQKRLEPYLATCSNIDPCPRIQRCHKPDSLPF